ncbi:MAG: hypothetical protein DCF17_12130 [Shackletoniella antarctica]|uniref:DUF1257 domain-containing protein n=1 Tax=Shackletoniella antarctica TaxID=268115 RepID=A0A2W4WEK7_9CYAN|nr:MAG: hypothetical protein DCF17_12130 [Shackletoniella antarctica]
MSHFSQIKTKIRNLESLKLALNDLGTDWKAGPCDVRGYQGQTQSAEVVIAQDNGYDIGFRCNPETSDYELVADLQYWQQPLTVEGFLSQVTQRYAYNAVVTETSRQGFQLAEEQVQKDGSVRLVVQRWNG